MKGKTFFVGAVLALLLLALNVPVALSETYSVTNISQNPAEWDSSPQINAKGEVVWESGAGLGTDKIYLFDGTIAKQISVTEDNRVPQINPSGLVVWAGGTELYDIYQYDGTSTSNITNSPDVSEFAPQINVTGQIVWQGCGESTGCEIYFYDGLTIKKISNNELLDRSPQLNAKGEVVWETCAEEESEVICDVYLYDGATVKNISAAEDNRYPLINDNGQVVWRGRTGTNFAIYLYDGLSAKDISNDTVNQFSAPQMNSSGQVVWAGSDGEIHLYDGTTVKNISNREKTDSVPQINDNGQVAWAGMTETGNNAIFLFDGNSVRNISNTLSLDDYSPQINENGQVTWHAFDGTDFEVYLATPSTTSETDITNVISFIETSLLNGSLVAVGPTTKAAQGKANAFVNMIKNASDLISAGDGDGAVAQLKAAYAKIDGKRNPPDFMTGDNVNELAAMILDLIDELRVN
jgi:hypothetical protein